ncbi:UDP-N-acetylmuramoyl-tripeptide--D-alanyl-D-alanine ligase [Azoarcus sp. KH32C]|uniref:UDP-N-acetylmuramoyl-tripeptide--D-alanyl-D- alanine ligase n=1 Tax=Azoarcus sp. KH32C TaxID=748247 RepID=UPI0002386CCE|nr:UDP-N-acetylmuramoyl-tripeptide--D-alanyl-D-alanine ligase [Azoarcus sp. KH32C]BAL26014.1 UDP-N-acetylmuramoylalanyl-D-glutamyl-2, 6-diaminopimelate-D-alanyl-D-alanine ligase [Azoarcus sp. KH32C]
MLTLQEVAQGLDLRATAEARFDCVGTDSRRIRAGQLFVALRGERFDGHDFVALAGEQGAVAALVDAAWAAEHGDVELPLLIADDTRLALGALAAFWRRRFEIPLIGVTGSNGKTTVKEMCAAIMRAQARLDGRGPGAVLATSGNLNNDIGLPLTLLELRDGHCAAIIEMGMNHPGEIAYLTDIARPTVAIVTNAQRAHLMGMGSLVEIAHEKGAIYAGLAEDGVAIVNADDPHAAYWSDLNAGRRVMSFGMEHPADVTVRCTQHGFGSSLELVTPRNTVKIELQVPGVHNVRNAAGAAAACLAAGATLEAVVEGLAGFSGAPGRLQRRPGLGGAVILDDTYNANPDSMRAAIDVLASTAGHTVLVLGDMGEIGQTSAQLHDEIGGYAKSKGIDTLYALGEMSAVAAHNFGEGAHHFDSPEALVAALEGQLDPHTVVLVKGSRFMRMERVANALAAVHNGAPSQESH